MVQLVMDGVAQGDARWDNAETYLRDRFCYTGGAGSAIRGYYYGLYSLTKAMLEHDANGDGLPDPLPLLQSQTPSFDPIAWYGAEASKGDDCDGVARTLVNDQTAAGYCYGNNYTGAQYPFETGWAIVMLNQTLFDPVPVAVAKAIPNPALAGDTITLDGSDSFHQNPAQTIVSWEWDLECDGTYDLSGVTANTSFASEGDYCVRLKVTDNGSPAKTDTDDITISIIPPPVPPTADANGPYVFCPQTQPWFLDGTGSVNPDEGIGEAGQPGNTIIEYCWNLDGIQATCEELGPTPDVTAYYQAQGPGGYIAQLKVTDNTATSHPSFGEPNLSDIDSAQVLVKDGADPACECVNDLAARPKSGKVQLTWTDTGASSYNVYRGTTMGGPYVLLANTTSTYSTYLDTNVANGTTYYYVVREAALNGDDLCQSNEASATPQARGGR
jgi:hypothetical protein